ncbi:hypothetical protein M9H77_17774 [Catharanthus roseus]|uniref:Uncharacterized protein n=1 Tax=Catharanthus roseus TaxID=4058 RepID=A0ACC0B5J4_CATRO|nr:hypothetical protein M9H77_17774 [Catharanthus roseus]
MHHKSLDFSTLDPDFYVHDKRPLDVAQNAYRVGRYTMESEVQGESVRGKLLCYGDSVEIVLRWDESFKGEDGSMIQDRDENMESFQRSVTRSRARKIDLEMQRKQAWKSLKL